MQQKTIDWTAYRDEELQRLIGELVGEIFARAGRSNSLLVRPFPAAEAWEWDEEEIYAYDWYNEIGYRDFSALHPGRRVLFEEQALSPEWDEPYQRRLKKIKIPPIVHQVSPRGFLHIDPSDEFWIDPRDRKRRIHEARIGVVTPQGEVKFGRPDGVNPIVSRRCIVDILPEWEVPPES